MDFRAFISPWDVSWLLYIPTLYLFIGSDGFQVLGLFMGLSSLNGVVSRAFFYSSTFEGVGFLQTSGPWCWPLLIESVLF